MPCPTFDALFEAVRDGRAGYGMAPVENSLAGTVRETWDLLVAHDLPIVAEVRLPVRHCLLARRGTRLADVRRAYSHPQALAQSAEFLAAHGIAAVPAYDTAGAARELAGRDEAGAAAIASARAAAIYDLAILAEGIQARDDNTTRFYVIAREAPAGLAAEKASVVFTAAHRPGGLVGALQAFAAHGLNMTMIESRPTRETPWQYRFQVDLDGGDRPIDRAALAALIEELGGAARGAKVLGVFPRA